VSTVGTRWYTLAEAAPVLGVSVDTVRRRLKRGELESRQVHTQHGPTWEVCLGGVSTEYQDAAQGSANGAQGAAVDDAGAGMVQLVALVDRLQRENRDLAGQVGFLTAQLAAATDRLAVLEAPPHAKNGMLEPSAAVQAQEPSTEPSAKMAAPGEPGADTSSGIRPWWKRWLAAVYG
jgi:excisionase family DNA binding protein